MGSHSRQACCYLQPEPAQLPRLCVPTCRTWCRTGGAACRTHRGHPKRKKAEDCCFLEFIQGLRVKRRTFGPLNEQASFGSSYSSDANYIIGNSVTQCHNVNAVSFLEVRRDTLSCKCIHSKNQCEHFLCFLVARIHLYWMWCWQSVKASAALTCNVSLEYF